MSVEPFDLVGQGVGYVAERRESASDRTEGNTFHGNGEIGDRGIEPAPEILGTAAGSAAAQLVREPARLSYAARG